MMLALGLGCLLTIGAFAETRSLNREDIAEGYKWKLSDIYSDWAAWEEDFGQLEGLMDEFAALKGSLNGGAQNLLKAFQLSDKLDILSYKVYRYPQLMRDLDTRDQLVSQKLQQVMILFSKFGTATAWLNPEMLQIPGETMQQWLNETPELAPYRFGIEDLYRQQAHVFDEDKETMLSYFSPFNSTPRDIYSELSTSDIQFPSVTLSSGEEVIMTSGTYSKILATNRNQTDRKLAFENHYEVYDANKNTYSAIYSSVC